MDTPAPRRHEPDVAPLAEAAVARIADLAARDVLAVAWSGGKDSSAVLVLALAALRRARLRSDAVAPLLVLNGDTEIENPAVRAVADDQLEELRAWAEREGLPLRVEVYRPALNATWAVKVVGGMALPRYAGAGTRDCSVDWKVEPAARALRRLLPEMRGDAARALSGEAGALPGVRPADLPEVAARLAATRHPLVLLGSRFEESADRARSMAAHGQEAAAVSEMRDPATGRVVSRTLSPIADWAEEDVWELLGHSGTDAGVPWGWDVWMPAAGFGETVRLYRDAAGGACVVVPGAGRPGRTACGARTGCWNCQAVGEDRSLNEMLKEPRHVHLARLAEIRDFVAAIRHDWGRRSWLGRRLDPATGALRIGPNNFSDETLETLALSAMSADRAEAERAARFADAVAAGRDPDEPHVRACRERGEEPDPAWMRRMARPQFRTYTIDKVVALDFYWSLYGHHGRPFHALDLAWRVWAEGEDHRPPPVFFPARPTPVPESRWRALAHPPERMTGASDALAVALEEWMRGGSAVAPRLVGPDRGPIPDSYRVGPDFEVDPEAAALVFELEFPARLRAIHDRPEGSVTQGALYYLRTGVVRLSPQGLQACHRILQRTQAAEWSGMLPGTPPAELLRGAFAEAARAADPAPAFPAMG